MAIESGDAADNIGITFRWEIQKTSRVQSSSLQVMRLNLSPGQRSELTVVTALSKYTKRDVFSELVLKTARRDASFAQS